MSEDTNTTDDGNKTLAWSEVKERENAKREATKELVLEYDDGTEAIFEYQMVEDVGALFDEHSTTRPTRTGQEPQREMSDDDEWAFAADLFSEAIVSAPEGFKPTVRELREGLTLPVREEMVDAIVNFSTMSECEYLRFR